MFNEKRKQGRVKADAVFAYKDETFFAKVIPQGIEELATVTKIKKGFIIRPKSDLVMSVTGFHNGGKGCCRILFARKDRKKNGGRNLGFAKEAKHKLVAQFHRVGGTLSHLSTSLRHILIYDDEVMVGSSINSHRGGFMKKLDLFRSNNPLENEANEILAA